MAVLNDLTENKKESLIDIDSSKELWLMQWPTNQIPDIDGKEVKLELDVDGRLGSFTSSSGKVYELVSFASQEPDATVVQAYKSGSKLVGKVSRRVSVIHYQEPSELEKPKVEEIYQKTITTSSSSRQKRSSAGMSQYIQSMFQPGGSGSSKRARRNNDRAGSANQGSEGRDQSGVTSLGSMGCDHSGVTSTGSAGSSGRKLKNVKEEEY